MDSVVDTHGHKPANGKFEERIKALSLWRKKDPIVQQPASSGIPDGWHEGMLVSIQIQRRHGRQWRDNQGQKQYQPSGWDLVDTQTGQVIGEYNDETAPPPLHNLVGHRGLAPQNGNELGEMFKEIYRIANGVTLDAMRLMARALPQHKDSNDGEPIAQIVIGAYNRLPQTIKMTNKEAYNATQPF